MAREALGKARRGPSGVFGVEGGHGGGGVEAGGAFVKEKSTGNMANLYEGAENNIIIFNLPIVHALSSC